MKRALIFVCVIVLFIASTAGIYLYQAQKIVALESEKDNLADELAAEKAANNGSDQDEQQNQESYTSKKGVAIVVSAPAKDSTVATPLEVTGDVPGSWTFEGNFAVKLVDENGATVTEQPATIRGDWMTEDLVPFSVILIYSKPDSATGSLVLEKANPSDLPENDDSVTIPIRF